jgi:DNA polymerase-3 subunit delta'
LLKNMLRWFGYRMARCFLPSSAMSLHPLIGHQDQRKAVARAFEKDVLPQLLLLTGPVGVGKQRFGLWLGQLLLCQKPDSEPCGICHSCRLVLELSHPDLHWLVPVPRPKATEPEKQIEELTDTYSKIMVERRGQPLYGPPDGMAGHFMATSRLLQRRAALTPAMGRRKVFLVAEADRLVSQEASQEAGNALLKLLEEPPANTQFVLTASNADLVLPTIRSRSAPLRLGRLSDSEMRELLVRLLEPPPVGAALEALVTRSRGAVPAASNSDGTGAARRASSEMLEAVLRGSEARAERALKQPTWAARGDFSAMLDALAESLAEAARISAQGGGRTAGASPVSARPLQSLVAAQERVQAAREAARGNVNPQLLLATLSDELAAVL